ncbi:hypothetical protein MRX96_004382 [Rhipicephalus microplus]
MNFLSYDKQFKQIFELSIRLIYYIDDEANRQGEAAVEEGGMAVGKIGEYRLGTDAYWDECVVRLEMLCVANKITMDVRKRAVLLSYCGEAAYGLIVTLVKPVRPTMASLDKIKMAVRKHLHPRPSKLYARYLFYKRNQAADETDAGCITALRKLTEERGFGDKWLPLDIIL